MRRSQTEKQPALEVEVEVEKLVYGGQGLARVDGQVMLAPFVLPGERVRLAAEPGKAGLLKGSLLSVLQPAEGRVTPKCEYFADCGGCQLQHATYDLQLAQKQAILRETLQRIGGVTYEGEIFTVSAEPWQYRNRVQVHFGDRKSGFFKTGSHDICSIEHCEIAAPILTEAIRKLQTAVRQPEWPPFLRSLELFTNGAELQMSVRDSTRPLARRFFEFCETFLENLTLGPIEYAAAGRDFRIGPRSFFQVNRFLVDALVHEVVGESKGEHAIDLYAGAGLFACSLAERFARVDAVEVSGAASADLAFNAGRVGANIECSRASAEEFSRALQAAPDLVIADPPRAGLGPELTAEMLRLCPPALKLVSCDTPTLARDLRKLLTKYKVARLALLDLFPQTYHFETVAHLELA